MNLTTIEMPKAEARKKFLEYRQSVRERHNAEDEEIMRGYRELSRGRQLIHLGDTIRAGGLVAHTERVSWQGDTKTVQLPALAVMRADQEWCYVEVATIGTVMYTPDRWYRGRRDRVVVRDMTAARLEWTRAFRAMVPPVPPALRPAAHLRNFHVLWEAEWSQDRTIAPGDPALIRRIGGELFAVLATWDLTDLERAVLGERGRP